jgi:hypothetical protein
VLTDSRTHTLAARTAVSDDFSLAFTQVAVQEDSYSVSVGDHYEIVLDVAPSGGGNDDFTLNDTKIYKFQLLSPHLYLPLVVRQ